MEEATRTQKIKDHFKKHKTTYIVGGTCFAAGAVTAGAVALKINKEGVQVAVQNKGIFYKSSITNVTTTLVNRDNPSIAVRCLDTGEVFASQNRAAKLLNIDPSGLSRHLRGLSPSVSGLTFERLEDLA